MNITALTRSAKVAVPVGILFLAVVTVYVLLANSPEASPHPVVDRSPVIEALAVTAQSVRVPVHTRGVVAPRNKVTLIAQVSGTAIDVAEGFYSGGFFKKDDVLIRLDPALYQLEITKKQRLVDAAIMNLEEVMARAHVAKQGAKKDATDFALHKPHLRDAKSQLAAAKADLALAKLNLSYTEIKAPFDGRFKTVNINKNQYISRGELLADIYGLEVAEVRLPISDQHLALIDLPARYEGVSEPPERFAPVTFSSVMGDDVYQWQGRIVRSEGGLDKNRLLYVVAEVNNPFRQDLQHQTRPPLEIGRFVEASIGGRQQDNVVVIPREAMRGQQQVWLVNDDNRLQIRQVDVLYRGREQVFIRQGLKNGERIVLTPMDFAVEGMKVRMASATKDSTAT